MTVLAISGETLEERTATATAAATATATATITTTTAPASASASAAALSNLSTTSGESSKQQRGHSPSRAIETRSKKTKQQMQVDMKKNDSIGAVVAVDNSPAARRRRRKTEAAAAVSASSSSSKKNVPTLKRLDSSSESKRKQKQQQQQQQLLLQQQQQSSNSNGGNQVEQHQDIMMLDPPFKKTTSNPNIHAPLEKETDQDTYVNDSSSSAAAELTPITIRTTTTTTTTTSTTPATATPTPPTPTSPTKKKTKKKKKKKKSGASVTSSTVASSTVASSVASASAASGKSSNKRSKSKKKRRASIDSDVASAALPERPSQEEDEQEEEGGGGGGQQDALENRRGTPMEASMTLDQLTLPTTPEVNDAVGDGSDAEEEEDAEEDEEQQQPPPLRQQETERGVLPPPTPPPATPTGIAQFSPLWRAKGWPWKTNNSDTPPESESSLPPTTASSSSSSTKQDTSASGLPLRQTPSSHPLRPTPPTPPPPPIAQNIAFGHSSLGSMTPPPKGGFARRFTNMLSLADEAVDATPRQTLGPTLSVPSSAPVHGSSKATITSNVRRGTTTTNNSNSSSSTRWFSGMLLPPLTHGDDNNTSNSNTKKNKKASSSSNSNTNSNIKTKKKKKKKKDDRKSPAPVQNKHEVAIMEEEDEADDELKEEVPTTSTTPTTITSATVISGTSPTELQQQSGAPTAESFDQMETISLGDDDDDDDDDLVVVDGGGGGGDDAENDAQDEVGEMQPLQGGAEAGKKSSKKKKKSSSSTSKKKKKETIKLDPPPPPKQRQQQQQQESSVLEKLQEKSLPRPRRRSSLDFLFSRDESPKPPPRPNRGSLSEHLSNSFSKGWRGLSEEEWDDASSIILAEPVRHFRAFTTGFKVNLEDEELGRYDYYNNRLGGGHDGDDDDDDDDIDDNDLLLGHLGDCSDDDDAPLLEEFPTRKRLPTYRGRNVNMPGMLMKDEDYHSALASNLIDTTASTASESIRSASPTQSQETQTVEERRGRLEKWIERSSKRDLVLRMLEDTSSCGALESHASGKYSSASMLHAARQKDRHHHSHQQQQQQQQHLHQQLQQLQQQQLVDDDTSSGMGGHLHGLGALRNANSLAGGSGYLSSDLSTQSEEEEEDEDGNGHDDESDFGDNGDGYYGDYDRHYDSEDSRDYARPEGDEDDDDEDDQIENEQDGGYYGDDQYNVANETEGTRRESYLSRADSSSYDYRRDPDRVRDLSYRRSLVSSEGVMMMGNNSDAIATLEDSGYSSDHRDYRRPLDGSNSHYRDDYSVEYYRRPDSAYSLEYSRDDYSYYSRDDDAYSRDDYSNYSRGDYSRGDQSRGDQSRGNYSQYSTYSQYSVRSEYSSMSRGESVSLPEESDSRSKKEAEEEQHLMLPGEELPHLVVEEQEEQEEAPQDEGPVLSDDAVDMYEIEQSEAIRTSEPVVLTQAESYQDEMDVSYTPKETMSEHVDEGPENRDPNEIVFKDFPRHGGTSFFQYRPKVDDDYEHRDGHVFFDKVLVREYNLTVGDSPSCTDSLPIMLDWDHGPLRVWAIDDYEKVKQMFPIPDDAEGMARRLSFDERRQLLIEVADYNDRKIRYEERAYLRQRQADQRASQEGATTTGFFSRLFYSSSSDQQQQQQEESPQDHDDEDHQDVEGEDDGYDVDPHNHHHHHNHPGDEDVYRDEHHDGGIRE